MQRHGSAPERLRRALKRRKLTYREAVEAHPLPAHFTRLHRIARGVCDPDLEMAVALEREFGIAVEEWPSLRQPLRELLKLRGIAA